MRTLYNYCSPYGQLKSEFNWSNMKGVSGDENYITDFPLKISVKYRNVFFYFVVGYFNINSITNELLI